MKPASPVKLPNELSVADQLRQLLSRVQSVSILEIRTETPIGEPRLLVDLSVRLNAYDDEWTLLVEGKPSGEPRVVRGAAWQLQRALKSLPGRNCGLVAAPFLSEASQAILREAGLGWLDQAGNCHLAFGGVYIDVQRALRNPFATKRSSRSLFAPKSARLLRLLLTSPVPWKVTDLAREAGVSLGQVSNVRQALLKKEWAKAEVGGGLRVTRPGAMLDVWREAARPPTIAMRGYSLAHGKHLETQLQLLFARAPLEGARILLASYSAARRMAPFARVAGEYFYADTKGVDLIRRHLELEPASKGENVTIYQPVDDTMWGEAVAPSGELRASSHLQTYLDLWTSGERGQEAADHFRRQMIEPLFTRLHD